jgi:hypothetical protein
MTTKSRTEVFVYIASVTGLAWALGMAAVLQESPASWIVAGAVFGLLMAAIGTPRLVGDTRTLAYTGNKEDFVGHVNVACSQIGYQPSGRTGDFLSYKATNDSSFSIGPIKLAPASYLALGVQVGENEATIVGPHKAAVDLEGRLRV